MYSLKVYKMQLKIWGGGGFVRAPSPQVDLEESPDEDHRTFKNAKFEMPNQHLIPNLKNSTIE